jgi:amidohydrolase
MMADSTWTVLDEVTVRLADFYRDLHRNPELSLREQRTAGLLADALRPLGYEVTEHVGGTGVVGRLGNGDGPVVMLRADIDALPVREQTGLPYASTVRATDPDGKEVPVMHACGHDMHATCLLGAAEVLARTPGTWAGTLLVVFQPAEELARGARDMVDDGLFDRFGVPAIVLGQHVGPLPAGMIGHASGPVMAASDSADVVLYGRGGHGSRPEATVDPVLMAANVVTRLQDIVSRQVPPAEAAVVTVGRLRAGTKENIIPDTAELGINVRTYTPAIRDLVLAAIERIIAAEATASLAPRPPDITWTSSTPTLVSDPDATRVTVAAFAEHFGEQRLLAMPLVTASEDVGIFGAAAGVPTVFWFWGGLEAETVFAALNEGGIDSLPSNHSPHFAPVIEPTLSTGVQALTVAARTWLGGQPLPHERPRGLPDDELGAQQHPAHRDLGVVDLRQDQLGRLDAHPVTGVVHRRQRRPQLGGERQIVETDHRDVLRDPQPRPLKRQVAPDRQRVVGGRDRRDPAPGQQVGAGRLAVADRVAIGDPDQPVVGLDPALLDGAGETAQPVVEDRHVERAGHEADPGVPQPEQVPDRGPLPRPVVGVDHRADLLGRGPGHHHHRHPGGRDLHDDVVRDPGGGDDQPLDPPGGHRRDQRPHAGRVIAGKGDPGNVTGAGQGGVRAPQEVAHPRVPARPDQHPDLPRGAAPQRLGDRVGHVAELVGGRPHPGDRLVADQRLPVRVERPRGGGAMHPRLPGDVLQRHVPLRHRPFPRLADTFGNVGATRELPSPNRKAWS